MFKLMLRYTRYALASLATLAFGLTTPKLGPTNRDGASTNKGTQGPNFQERRQRNAQNSTRYPRYPLASLAT
jgi:hypothetical protein